MDIKERSFFALTFKYMNELACNKCKKCAGSCRVDISSETKSKYKRTYGEKPDKYASENNSA